MPQKEIPSIITLNGVSMTWETAKLGLDKVLWNTADSVKDFVPLLTKKGDFKQKTLKRKTFSGIADATDWDASSVISAQGIEQMYDIIATHTWYGNAVIYDLETKTFDEYNMIPKLPVELGKSMAVKRQRLLWAFFLNGYSQNGIDGVPFFSQYHPNDNRIGGTQANVVQGTLGTATLDAAINMLLGLTDPLGRIRDYTAGKLFVHPTKWMLARQVLGIDMDKMYQPDSNNSIRNEYKDFDIEIVKWPWMYPTDTWILQANEHEVRWSDAISMQTRMKEEDDHSTRHESWASSAVWYDNWNGYVGGTGASITAL
jgi:hypothetical protein